MLIKYLISIITITFLLELTISISVPISSNQSRCMIVYSTTNDQTVKLDIRFPVLAHTQKQNHDYFNIHINNTQTFQVQRVYVKPGQTFRRQMQLDTNVMYRVCFTFHPQLQYPGYVNVQYQAYHAFRVTNNNRHTIAIPDSIMKRNQLKQSYEDSLYLLDLTQRKLSLNDQHKKQEQIRFKAMESISGRLVYISFFEIAFMIVVGVIQFFVIKKHLAGELRI